MGQLAFGVVGAAISTYVGAGPAIGWAVGTAIGGVVFAPDGPQTTGPRLEDLKSNVSTYGQPIPRCYGQIGFMGSLIWMDDIQEAENVEEEGKGGDPATATTFTYSCSFAMILCRGEDAEIEGSVPVAALNRIWINEKCYYDVRDETNVEAMAASSNFQRFFKFYPGSQTQLPDPTMEAILGVGNVPAYRGRSYIVFTDFPLGMVQNQPPGALRITFEVTMTGTPPVGLRQIHRTASPASGSGNANRLIMPVVEGVVRVIDDPALSSAVIVNNLEGILLFQDSKTDDEEEWPSGGTTGYADGTVAVTRLYDGSSVRTYQFAGTYAMNNASNRLYAELSDGGKISALPLLLPQTDILEAVVPSADQRHVFAIGYDGADYTWHLLQWDAAELEWVLVDTGPVGTNAISRAPGPASQGLYYAAMAESDLRYLWWLDASPGAQFRLHWIDETGTLVLVDTLVIDFGVWAFSNANIWVDNGTAYAFAEQYYYVVTRLDGAAVNDQTLEEVHTAECLLGGLESAQIEASALSAITVDGMFVRRLGAPRGVLQALQPAYFYDTYESSGQLKAKLRGGSSVVTIEDDELGAAIGGVAEEDLINPERSDEDSLPGAAIVTYIDRASDYQVAAQHDRRSAVETDQPVNLEMPLVFTPDDARQIASVWLYNQWISRTKRTVRLSRKYSYLEPTDIITLRTDVADFVVRITSIKTNDGFLEVECVDEDAALYTQNAEGANIDQGTEIVLVTATKMVLLDIPMLRESDDDPGFYVAAGGYSAGWPGAVILRSFDGGITFTTVATMTTATTMGNVAVALGNYVGPMGYDAVNQITVTLFDDTTLQSVTDAELLAGANAFALGTTALGYEIVQFKTAALVSGRTWTLTQLLRGRRGTEHEMSGHGTYENFVLLEASKMRRIAIDTPEVGIENHYKAVTFGQLVTNAATQAFTNTAASLKPYSPVNAHATGFGGDITITWTRRGRIYNDWHDGIELPLGEASESYSVDIYSGASIVRTLTSSTPTVTYTTAQQTTDWGSPQPASLSVRIYQISAIVGRGFPFIGTLS
jgi:hypothetical protein